MSKIISFDIENSFGENSVCFGIDEAGRGCLAGPVVAGCCWMNRRAFPQKLLSLINDSKKISEAKREDIFLQLSALPSDVFMYEWADVSAKVIDEINILQASLLAMKNAYFKLMEKVSFNPDIILVDGNKSPSISPCKCVIGGDAISYSIATASIIAKVNKDHLLNEIGERFPQYEFCKNKGYGTKGHLEALEKFGICPYHRKTYAPVKKFVK
ncbi:ribonuclease HII [bacterium]|nr:ribonuclease HII [bacterium]MDE6224025.1 ribonuclease HII [Alphaproteobacteria bacterium]